MEFIKPKIEIYKTRTFSEKITDTFSFLTENWKPLLKYFLYLMLPICIVLTFFTNHFWSGYMSLIMDQEQMATKPSTGSFMLNMGLTAVVFIVAYVALIALVFALIRLYRSRPNRLQDLQTDELKPQLMACMKRAAVLVLFSVALLLVAITLLALIVAAGVALHSAFGILLALLLYIGAIAVVIPISLMTPIYMLEDDTSIVGALRKALRLGFATWGGIAAVGFVVGILASVIQTITMMPWYVLFLVKLFFTVQADADVSFTNSIFYTFSEYASGVLENLGLLLSIVITMVGTTIQYGHAADKVDSVGVANQIVNFDEF